MMILLLVAGTAFLAWTAIFRTAQVPFWVAAMVTFVGLRPADFGIGLDLSKIAIGAGAGFVILAGVAGFRRSVPTTIARFATFTIVTVILGAVFWYADAQDLSDIALTGAQSTSLRTFVQGGQRIANILCVFLAFLCVRQYAGHSLILDGFIAGTTAQCALASYQVLGALVGLPFLDTPMNVAMDIQGIMRASALAGEPRHLAASLLPSTIVLFARQIEQTIRGPERNFFSRNNGKLLGLHVIILTLTFSTSGWGVGLVAGGLVVVRLSKRYFRFAGLAIALLASVMVYNSVADASVAGMDWGRIWEQRMTTRISEDFYRRSEFSNAAALEYLEENRVVLIAGVGVGNPVFYYRTMPSFDHRNPTTRDCCGLILLFFESGVIIAAIFLYWIGRILATGIFSRVADPHWRGAQISVALAGLTTLLVGVVGYGPLSAHFMLFLGETVAIGAAAVARPARKQETPA